MTDNCRYQGQLCNRRTAGKAFSLSEIVVAMTIGAMVVVAVLSIYNRCEATADSINRRLDESRLPNEVMQRIANDLRDVMSGEFNTTVFVENKTEHGMPSARLTIERKMLDETGREQIFEKIVWQTVYDAVDNRLVLYRSHSGTAGWDRLLDRDKEDWERELYVPVCLGVTYFKLQVPRGDRFYDRWTTRSLPRGVVATLSFAEPFETASGVMDVPDSEKITRAMAIDRTRKIGFIVAIPEPEQDTAEDESEQVDEGSENAQTEPTPDVVP